MSSDNSFHLVWDNYLENVNSLFQILYKDDKLVDVTIACQDGCLKAHKLILSACSQYFERIFHENPCKHPVVIIRGVRYEEMQLILDYIYKGFIDIPGNLLNNLICVASELEIKGFENFKGLGNRYCNSCSNNGENCKELRFTNQNHEIETDSEDVSQTPPEYKTVEETHQNILDQIQISEVKSEAHLVQYKTGISCTACRLTFRSKKDLLYHQKSHKKTDKPHKCDFCFSSFTRSSHLARHRRTHTGERPYHCLLCDKSFARQDKLKQHTKSTHGDVPLRRSPSPLSPEQTESISYDVVPASPPYSPSPPPLPLPSPTYPSYPEHNTIKNEVEDPEFNPGFPENITLKKRGRGRPRKRLRGKCLQQVDGKQINLIQENNFIGITFGPKRQRGRPRKFPVFDGEMDAELLPPPTSLLDTVPEQITIEPLIQIINTEPAAINENGVNEEKCEKEDLELTSTMTM